MSNISYTEYCRRNFHWQTEFNNIKGKVIPIKTNKQTHFRLCKVHHSADIVAVCLMLFKPHSETSFFNNARKRGLSI